MGAKLVPAAEVRANTKSKAVLKDEDIERVVWYLVEGIEEQRKAGYFEYTSPLWNCLDGVPEAIHTLLTDAGYKARVTTDSFFVDGKDHLKYRFHISWA
jgi:hypothetical protein